MLKATANMLSTIEDERASLEVQRLTNSHELSDTAIRRPDGTEVTYMARLAELDKLEDTLRENTPPKRWRQARETAGLSEPEEESK